MNTICGWLLSATVLATLALNAYAQTPDQIDLIRKALPKTPMVKPQSPRKVLVFTATRGFRHDSIPVGVAAMKLLGESTGAFSADASEDIARFEKDALAAYDAIIMLNTTGELFTPPDFDKLSDPDKAGAAEREKRLQANFREFVESGKGLVGIHAATDTFYKFAWYGEAIGGYFDGHPWTADTEVVIRVDDPGHPVARPIISHELSFKEEIYQLREPYSRQRQRVLLSLDTKKTDMKRDGIKRTDGDFGVSWVRNQGKGRVFYCSLGHNAHIYWHPEVLEHYLAGIQFALGDLKAETTTVPPSKRDDRVPPPPTPPTRGGPRETCCSGCNGS